jgi:signal transduction histidine kinase
MQITMSDMVVLVVDDEQTYIDTIAETLKERNFKIVQAFNGKMGCLLAKKFNPDIIIVDWEMPEMNGIEMIVELKKDELTRDIPVIMCTGIMTSSNNLDAALNAGAVDYIRKPVEPIELTARINSALNMADAFKNIKSRNKQIEKQKLDIEQKNLELLELNATKDKLFAIIGHDLRGPLSSFITLIELLISRDDFKDTETLIKILNVIKNSANSTYDLLENLLSWAKSQRNEIVFKPEAISLNKVISEIIDLFSELTREKEICIINNIPDNTTVIADKNMITTVIRNLVSNAIKFTENGKQISLLAYKNETEHIITIKDEGVGIPPEDLSKLFNKNEHLSTHGTNNEKGSGLGLLLCKDFVEKHHGKIWVVSELEKGSDFIFTIPLNHN